jgi:hypothetical protein
LLTFRPPQGAGRPHMYTLIVLAKTAGYVTRDTSGSDTPTAHLRVATLADT